MLILYGFYRILLEDENIPVFKRFYLLATVLFSLIIPLVTFTYTVEAPSFPGESMMFAQEKTAMVTQHSISTNWVEISGIIILGIYLFGVLFFAFRFCRNLFTISREIRNNEKKSEFPYIFVLIRRKLIPYSFLRYIFLGKSDYENDNISHAVLEHEKAHVDQKHSWDLLFIEFLNIIFWFNPLFIELKRAIRLNHEFLADREVLNGSTNPVAYSQLLFSYNSVTHHNSLYSPINNSLIKKRIIMISKGFSKKRFIARMGILLPVLALCIFLFNNEIVAKTVTGPNANDAALSVLPVQEPKKIHIKISGESIYLNGEEVKLKNFGKELDKLTKDFTAEEISEMDFNVQTRDPDRGLVDKLENEFQKTRFAEITSLTILPPPPPPAPEVRDVPPPPPPAPHYIPAPNRPGERLEHRAPVPTNRENHPPHPSHPPMPPAQRDSLRKMALIDMRMAERERKRMEDLEKRYAGKQELLDEKKQELLARSQERRLEIQERMSEMMDHRQELMEERQLKIQERQRANKDRQREIQKIRDSIRKNNSSGQ